MNKFKSVLDLIATILGVLAFFTGIILCDILWLKCVLAGILMLYTTND